MAITGRRFLDLNKVDDLVITDHAQDRLSEVAGFTPTFALAKVWFQNARQLRADEMHALGYRPGYRRRKAQGECSWYFRFRIFAQECVAVVPREGDEGPIVWVTTYVANTQTLRFRGEPLSVSYA